MCSSPCLPRRPVTSSRQTEGTGSNSLCMSVFLRRFYYGLRLLMAWSSGQESSRSRSRELPAGARQALSLAVGVGTRQGEVFQGQSRDGRVTDDPGVSAQGSFFVCWE